MQSRGFVFALVAILLAACGQDHPAPSSNKCFPVMRDPQPIGELPAGTRTSVMGMKTDRDAVCRWGEVEGLPYVELPYRFESTGSRQHATPIMGLADGRAYRWYAKCEALDTGCTTPHDLIFGFHVAAP